MRPSIFYTDASSAESLAVRLVPLAAPLGGCRLLQPLRPYNPPLALNTSKYLHNCNKIPNKDKISPVGVSDWISLEDGFDDADDDAFVKTPSRKRLRKGPGLNAVPASFSTAATRCMTCSMTLPSGESRCSYCERPSLVSIPVSPVVVSIDDDAKSEEGVTWSCPTCTFLNSCDDSACEMCGQRTSARQGSILSRLKDLTPGIGDANHSRDTSTSAAATAACDDEGGAYSRAACGSNIGHDDNSWEETDVYNGRGDGSGDPFCVLSDDSTEDGDDVENISDFEDDFQPADRRFHQMFSGATNDDIIVNSSFSDDPNLRHIVSVQDLSRAPGSTAIDFSKFVLGKANGRPANLKYEARKQSRQKKKKPKASSQKKAFGGASFKRKRTA